MRTRTEETQEERAVRFSRIWSASRTDCGKTQDFMARGLGVSKKTVQNWESGVTAPDLFWGSEWFRVLGTNPLPYYLSFLYPDLFSEVHGSAEDEEIEASLFALITDSTVAEKRELLYLMMGRHGSGWYELLQMFTAHCHTDMKCRVAIAHAILDNYEMGRATGDLVCPDIAKPDLTMLKQAVEEAKISVMRGDTGYTTVNSSIK